jgi:hypothetical protein
MEKVINVTPLENYTLELKFDGGEVRIFDVNPYLDYGIFQELKEVNYFKSVRIMFDSIAWPNGQDFSPETLFLKSIPITSSIGTSQFKHSDTLYI